MPVTFLVFYFPYTGHFVQHKLKLDGKKLPPSIPLVYPNNCHYDFRNFRIEPLPKNSVSATSLVFVPEAIQLLESISKPVAVVSICGPYRSGKSYFLSRVLGYKHVFKLGHSMNACTRGIWLSTVVLECDEFVVLFLDSEGADAVGDGQTSENFTTNILTLTTLLSSLLMYNSKEVPKKDDLRRMKYVSHFKQY